MQKTHLFNYPRIRSIGDKFGVVARGQAEDWGAGLRMDGPVTVIEPNDGAGFRVETEDGNV